MLDLYHDDFRLALLRCTRRSTRFLVETGRPHDSIVTSQALASCARFSRATRPRVRDTQRPRQAKFRKYFHASATSTIPRGSARRRCSSERARSPPRLTRALPEWDLVYGCCGFEARRRRCSACESPAHLHTATNNRRGRVTNEHRVRVGSQLIRTPEAGF